jgi:hypothetical protein
MLALLITGPPEAGKTEVLAALSDALIADRTPHVMVEVEALTSAYPALGDDRCSEAVRAVCGLYRRFGYDLLLVTATVEDQEELDDALAAIGADEHAVVRLEAAPVTLRRRIRPGAGRLAGARRARRGRRAALAGDRPPRRNRARTQY